jgi:hypothetical protein
MRELAEAGLVAVIAFLFFIYVVLGRRSEDMVTCNKMCTPAGVQTYSFWAGQCVCREVKPP